MKKIISILLVFMLCIGSVGVYAASVPSFMDKIYNNYTADYNISLKINNADEVAQFIKELNMGKIENYVDVEALVESLLDVSSVVNVEAEISEDFRKMNLALTMETDKNIIYNRNFESSYRAKFGMWAKIDVDNKELILVYSTPLNEKYAVIDSSKDFPSEVTDELFSMYDKMLNRENMEKLTKKFIEIATEHADISVKGNVATVKYDNDAFVAIIDDTLKYMGEYYEEYYSDMELYSEEFEVFSEFPSFEGVKLLGDEGIICEYQLSGDNIKSFSEKADISISVADIFTKITGEVWNYNFDGNINMTLETTGNITKIGTTKPAILELTEENSFHLVDLFAVEEDYGDYEGEFMPYLSSYVWGYAQKDTFDGERYYIPLRKCIEDVYYDYCDITYNDGLVTVVTNSNVEGRDINASFKVGENTAIVNGILYEQIGGFKLIDGSVYASIDFYEKCLGWTLDSLSKDLLDGSLSYGFYTVDNELYY